MRAILTTALLGISLLMAASCSSSKPKPKQALLLPLPKPPHDPSDALVAAAVSDFLKSTSAPAASSYEFSRIDLDDDGRRDALVLFKTPYGYWCGMHGCTLLVMKAHNDRFTLVNGIQPIREPVYISEDRTNGWKDMVVRVSGRWKEAKDVALRFDGRAYPGNPSDLPPYLRFAANEGERLFQD